MHNSKDTRPDLSDLFMIKWTRRQPRTQEITQSHDEDSLLLLFALIFPTSTEADIMEVRLKAVHTHTHTDFLFFSLTS